MNNQTTQTKHEGSIRITKVKGNCYYVSLFGCETIKADCFYFYNGLKVVLDFLPTPEVKRKVLIDVWEYHKERKESEAFWKETNEAIIKESEADR